MLGKRKTYPKKSLQHLGSPTELPQEVLVELHLDTLPFDQQHANIPPNEGNVLPLPYAGAELADGPLHAKPRRAFRDAGFRGYLIIRKLLILVVSWRSERRGA